MISYYKTVNGRIVGIDSYEPGCWINCVSPEEHEVNSLIEDFNIEPDFFRSALDEEETSHIDYENGTTLIIIDTPVVKRLDKHFTYSTMPLGIMITDRNVITVSLKENQIINEFADGVARNANTHFKTQFVLTIMLKIATKYLQYLNQIDKITGHVENEMRRSMKNQELIQLLEIEKSLVYFSSSLKASDATLEKIMRGRYIKLYEEDQDLLEDVLIEIKQGIDMANIYLSVLSGTMEAYGSVISNNLNIVMKRLTSVSLLISIPTVVSGIYGMNNPGIPAMDLWWAPFLISVLLMGASWFILRKTDML